MILASALSILLAVACGRASESEPGVAASVSILEIDWRDGDVAEAFAEAGESGQPVILYWGAVWCPPCNRLKSTLFKDPDFVASTREFVSVYLDGDSEGAQRWGDQFAITGYPTLIILQPDQSEITRISGGADPDEIVSALKAARQSKASAASVVAKVQAAPKSLTKDDWTLISAYGWEVDANRLIPIDRRAGFLERLAAAAPDPVQQRRFAILALTSRDLGPDAILPAPAEQSAIRDLLFTVLANPSEVRRNRWSLIYNAPGLVRIAGPAPAGQANLAGTLTRAMDKLYEDASLPLSDRLSAIMPEIEFERAKSRNSGEVSPVLLEKVRARVAAADAAAATPFERQSAIYDAAGLLEAAGDVDGAERLLLAELKRSATPFYYMPSLAGIAEARGDNAAALEWLREGYETSTGSASRVQWGTLYALGVIRLTPSDKAGVETAAGRIIDELGTHPDSYHQRTRARLARLEAELREWAEAHGGAGELGRLKVRMHDVCPRTQTSEEARAACTEWLAGA